MGKQRKLLYFSKSIIITILFLAALYFENAQKQRLFILIAIFALYLIFSFGKIFIEKNSKQYFFSFILDIALVYILEYNSRLLINYFFHTFYIVILLEASLTLSMKRGIVVGLISVFVSMIKYMYLIYYKFNLSSISQMVFFLMANILILVVTCFAQYNKEEREKKDILYKELLDVHRKLKEYNDEVNRLSVVEERNRIAREVHDSLGHNMTALIMQLQMTDYYLKEDSVKAGSLLSDSLKTAKNSLREIREVVETLRGQDNALLAEETIRNLIHDFSHKTGAIINLNITGSLENQYLESNADLYRIIQESMTNSIRHGKASVIWIDICYLNNSIDFSVKDNGVGAENISEGYGLKGISERVRAYNGEVVYGSENGFYIKGTLNLKNYGGER